METHVCVFQTARELARRGLDVHVVADAVASRREEQPRDRPVLCERAGAIVTPAETVVFDWLRARRHRRVQGDLEADPLTGDRHAVASNVESDIVVSRARICHACVVRSSSPCRLGATPGDAATDRAGRRSPSPDAITVLVVDDERSNVESLEKIFQREGMRVLTATTRSTRSSSCAPTASTSCSPI